MIKNLVYLVGSQVANIILGFVINWAIARGLGPAGKGYYDLIFGSANLLITLLSLSLASGVYYYAARESLHERRLYRILLLIALLQSLLVVTALYFLQDYAVTNWLLPDQQKLLAIATIPVVMLLQQMNGYAQTILGGKARFQSISRRNVATQLLATCLFVGLLFSHTTSPLLFIGAALLASLVNTGLTVYELWHLPTVLHTERTFLKEAFIYALPLAVGNLLQFMNYRLDVFIVNRYHGLYMVGVYTLAVSLAQLLWLVPRNLATLVLNKAAADREGRWRPEQVAQLSRLSVGLNLLFGVGIFVLAPFLTTLIYGERFQASVQPLLLLLPGIVAFSVTIVLSSQLAGIGKQVYTTVVAVAAFVCTLLLDLWLIPWLGASGAAIASTCSYLLSTVLTCYFFKQIYPTVELGDLLLLRRADVVMLFGLVQQFYQRFYQRVGAN